MRLTFYKNRLIEDVEMLQDLVTAAVNDALSKAGEMVSSEMNKLTGGMKIPGLM